MIRFFRSYRRTVFGILMFFAAALLMTSFGVNFSHQNNSAQKAAITINNTEISHREYFDRRRETESRYRQMLGANFDQLSKQFGLNIPQQVLDSMIAETLLLNDLSTRGFAVSDEKVLEMIRAVFPGGYDSNALKNSGKSPQQFLHETENDGLKAQFQELLKDVSLSSRSEANVLSTRKNTTYDVLYAEITPKSLLSTIPQPTDEQLRSFFENRKNDFELPARVSYEYVVFSPDQFLDSIEVAQDEIDFYYTDNQAQFEIPEALKIRHIQLLFPKESNPEKLSALKAKAKEAFEKAKSGESFASLVSKYSDDFTTASNGGDLGWVPKGQYSGDFDEKSYKVKDGGLADLIETDNGYHVVKVEGHRDSSLKPLSDVKAQIELILKKEQAPAYADTKAREFFDLVINGDTPLSEVARAKGLTVLSTPQLLAAAQNPDAALPGLTAKVIESSFEPKQLIDLKDKSVVVSIREAKEPEIPSLDTIKEAVVKAYKEAQSITRAHEKASELLAASKNKDFESAAKSLNIQVQKEAALTSTKNIKGVLSTPALREQLFLAQSPQLLPEVYSHEGSYCVVRVASVSPPKIQESPGALNSIRDEHTNQLGDVMTNSVIEYLKSQAKISIDNSILSSEL